MNDKVWTHLQLVTSDTSREEVREVLQSMLAPIRSRAQCIDAGLWQNAENSNELSFSALWENEESVEKFIRSGTYKQLLDVMELATEPPKLLFASSWVEQGMAYVARVRTQNSSELPTEQAE